VVTTAIVGNGTTESEWAPWLAEPRWPRLDLASIAGRRVVVLAAHPDDEVLGVGGLMMALARAGHDIIVVWATDGEASHPGSVAMSPASLRKMRRQESRAALGRLAVMPSATYHLGLPDSALASARDRLSIALSRIVSAEDLLVAPWSQDGHPDHEALGAEACRLSPLTWQYPIWMWHWATPNDDRVPWQRFRSTEVADLATKEAAISMFRSQIEPIGPASADAAVLPPEVLARFVRPHEWIIT
jgi:LmbE family N-acetylglucosaminyl deacetylase